MEIIGPALAALLTLMVLSYILGDNALFKLAAHLFVGVAVGYAIIVMWYEVFAPALGSGSLRTVAPALILCFLLLFKIRPAQSGLASALGGVTLAFLLGVGASLAIGGALFGTLMPQIATTAAISLNPGHYQSTETETASVELLNNIIIVLGTVGTFFYFTFAVRAPGLLGGFREGFVRFWAGMGRLMIIFTLGALFANTVSSKVALLVSRLQFLASFFGG
jgi:hypothetical protein